MDFLGGNSLAHQVDCKLLFTGLAVALCVGIALSKYSAIILGNDENPSLIRSLLLFCYACFFKPHKKGGKGTQQDALESFYEVQAGVYDVTRKTLLQGREDMLALVAAQLRHKATQEKGSGSERRIWVDVSSYTGVKASHN